MVSSAFRTGEYLKCMSKYSSQIIVFDDPWEMSAFQISCLDWGIKAHPRIEPPGGSDKVVFSHLKFVCDQRHWEPIPHDYKKPYVDCFLRFTEEIPALDGSYGNRYMSSGTYFIMKPLLPLAAGFQYFKAEIYWDKLLPKAKMAVDTYNKRHPNAKLASYSGGKLQKKNRVGMGAYYDEANDTILVDTSKDGVFVLNPDVGESLGRTVDDDLVSARHFLEPPFFIPEGKVVLIHGWNWWASELTYKRLAHKQKYMTALICDWVNGELYFNDYAQLYAGCVAHFNEHFVDYAGMVPVGDDGNRGNVRY